MSRPKRGPPRRDRVREKDPEGRIVVHHRVVDTLARMRQAGTIDAAMLDAGREFQRSFILAQLDPLRAVDLLRVPGSGREPEPGNVQQAARNRVHRALLALGGPRQPGRVLRLARAGLRPVGARVGAAARLGRPAGAAGAGAGTWRWLRRTTGSRADRRRDWRSRTPQRLHGTGALPADLPLTARHPSPNSRQCLSLDSGL